MLNHCAPEEAGVRSEGIMDFLDDMKQKHLHLHGLMILRHGQVIAHASFAPWRSGDLHMLFSLSKSFTSTAVGFAVQDGLLRLTDKLVDFFPEHLPCKPCENMQKITVKHLLTMNTGHGQEPWHQSDCWEKDFLRSYVEFEPGTHFLYNTFGTYMLAAVVQKVTGKKLLQYLREKWMDPLGMSGDIWWEESPTGVATGGYGLNVRLEDIAKMGQFYLQKGVWEGKRLLNEQWILDAQTAWSDNSTPGEPPSDWGCGYGYQFWMCQPEHVYRGDGAFGQYCIILPDQDMVIAINSGVEDMGAVMRSIWDRILPAVGDVCPPSDKLKERLAHTVTPARWEDREKETAAPVPDSGWLGRYLLTPGNSQGIDRIEIRQQQVILTLRGHETALPLDRETWQPFSMAFGDPNADANHYLEQAAVRAARKENALILHICYTRTPFEDVLKLTFTPHGVQIHGMRNVGFGPSPAFDLTGIRED